MFQIIVTVGGISGYCEVLISDRDLISIYNAELIDIPQPITRDVVEDFLYGDYCVMQVETLEKAVFLAEDLYKKLPRYERAISYMFEHNKVYYYQGKVLTESGTLREEISNKVEFGF